MMFIAYFRVCTPTYWGKRNVEEGEINDLVFVISFCLNTLSKGEVVPQIWLKQRDLPSKYSID